MVSKFLTPLVVVVLLLGAAVSAPHAAMASSDPGAWAIATNNQTLVSINEDGTLELRVLEGGATALPVPGLEGEKFSSVVWDGKFFVATSYFTLFYSSDGKSWSRLELPTGDFFNPGNIIENQDFFDSSSMSGAEISDFIDAKVDSCRTGYVCLEDYSERTWNRAATVLCDQYVSGGVETAAQIIRKVAKACAISPQVLLVLLQKEQGLITHTWPSRWRFERATGYACPDTAPCDSQYYGFYNQVYNAAKQFRRYSNPPGTSRFFTWYPVGASAGVLYHPNASCGRKSLTIENQATANLYYYTPYVPNSASVDAYSGTGDSCSSYGNRNFWRYFNAWFSDGGDYKNWPLTRNGVGVVVDQDGTTLSVDLQKRTWAYGESVPGGRSGEVASAGLGVSGQFVVERNDGKQFRPTTGTRWAAQELEILVSPGIESFDSTVAPTVVGDAVLGGMLTASLVGDWDPVPESYAYQWLVNGKAIKGATGSTYVLGKKDVGKRVSVRVVGAKAGYLSETVTSALTTPVLLGFPFDSTVAPTVVGDAVLGGMLTASLVGDWDPVPESYAYQWLVNGKAIKGATGSTYVLGKKDVGKRVSVRVVGAKAGYLSETVTSALTTPVLLGFPFDSTVAPTVVGDAVLGGMLTASLVGDWDPVPESYAYQWLVNGKAIKGATGSTYVLGKKDVGKRVSVRVVGAKAGYLSETVTSALTTPVLLGFPFDSTVAPTVVGDAVLGGMLTASLVGDWDPVPESYAYQWLVNGKAIKGATGSTYVLGKKDVGKRVSVRVVGAKAGYVSQAQVSSNSDAITG